MNAVVRFNDGKRSSCPSCELLKQFVLCFVRQYQGGIDYSKQFVVSNNRVKSAESGATGDSAADARGKAGNTP